MNLAMIAEKTYDEIILMRCWTRCRWYKKILPSEKEQAMKIVNIASLIKISETKMGHTTSEETRAKISAAHMGRVLTEEHKDNLRAVWTPEKRAEMSTIAAEIWKDPGHRNNRIGKNHYNWKGGSSFEPYGLEFNEVLKEEIRNRDNYVCQECDITQEELGYKLDVHHIDYDKKNNRVENLISLCRSCHCKTNYNRDSWIMNFKRLVVL